MPNLKTFRTWVGRSLLAAAVVMLTTSACRRDDERARTGEPATDTTGRPIGEPTTPGAGPGMQPGTEPGTEPGIGGQRGMGAEPGTGPTAGTQPGTQPGAQPGTQPGTQPGMEPGTQPGMEPGMGQGQELTSLGALQQTDDPRQLAGQRVSLQRVEVMEKTERGILIGQRDQQFFVHAGAGVDLANVNVGDQIELQGTVREMQPQQLQQWNLEPQMQQRIQQQPIYIEATQLRRADRPAG